MASVRVFLSLLLLAVTGSVLAQAPGGSKKTLSIDDLYRFDAPTNATLSPDGSRLAYVRRWLDAKSKRERHSLWLVEGLRDKARALEADEPDARAPAFSPDGKWIAFLSTRPRPNGWKATPPAPPESDPATDIWLMPTGGGPAIPLAGPDKPYGRVFNDGFYGRIDFAPDGKALVSGHADGMIHFWDPGTGRALQPTTTECWTATPGVSACAAR